MRRSVRLLSLTSLLMGACAAPMARMAPVQRNGQDLVYRNGIPILSSRGARCDVVLAPVTTATGRHEINDRVTFMARIWNHSQARLDVSEASFTFTANGTPTDVVTPAELEDEIRSNAAWARAAVVFAAAAASFDAGVNGGTTTYSGSVGGTPFTGRAYNSGQARQAQYAVATAAGAQVAAISGAEAQQSASLLNAFQRNTVEPGDAAGGFVVVRAPRFGACSRTDARGGGYRTPTPCKFNVTFSVAGEKHEFGFDEQFE